MSLIDFVMEQPLVYRAWMAPFAKRKFAPIEAHTPLASVRRVLDVGCGPGTNTARFETADYLGVDYNPRYIDEARRRYGRNFVVADITTYTVPATERYDFILVNSFLHHVDTPNAERILRHVAGLLTDDGHVHIVELVLPEGPGIPRALALADRGHFPRPLGAWRDLFERSFESVIFEPFALKVLGVDCWRLIYFKGSRRGPASLPTDVR